jgi:hypothetical protein
MKCCEFTIWVLLYLQQMTLKKTFFSEICHSESCDFVECRGAKVKGDEENVSGHKSGF